MSEKKKFDNSLKMMRLSLLYSGIKTNSTAFNKLIEVFVNSFLYYINMITLYTVIFGEIAWLIQGIQTGRNFSELTFVFPLITISVLSTVKSVNLYLNREIVCEIIDTLRDIHPEEESNDTLEQNRQKRTEEKITNESVTILNTVVNLLIGISGLVLIMFCLTPLITMGFDYFTKGETGILYPFVVEYWFDVHNTKLWPVLYLHQVIATVVVCTNLLASEIFFYATCAYIEMHFHILCHRFETLQLVSSRQLRKDLVSAVLKHQQLILFLGLKIKIDPARRFEVQ
ncbi:Odorant receptor [Operophtera brumata]|uniref:Odorant receptor n=1 Tax=Operophtera brumata TaxID=104452 RepID=A0A0L7L1S8_OPEBR|nr:Odorant receptor [Operophtera brumata]